MRVRGVMSRDVEYVDVAETAQAAAALMGEIDVGALPVGSPGATAWSDHDQRPGLSCLREGLGPLSNAGERGHEPFRSRQR